MKLPSRMGLGASASGPDIMSRMNMMKDNKMKRYKESSMKCKTCGGMHATRQHFQYATGMKKKSKGSQPDRATRGLWDFLDKSQGKPAGTSAKNISKARVSQGYSPIKSNNLMKRRRMKSATQTDGTSMMKRHRMKIKTSGKSFGKSNVLGHGGRAAQLKHQGVPGGVIGNLARAAHAAPGEKNFHGKRTKKKAIK